MYPCNHCDKRYSTTYNLKRHKLDHHGGDDSLKDEDSPPEEEETKQSESETEEETEQSESETDEDPADEEVKEPEDGIRKAKEVWQYLFGAGKVELELEEESELTDKQKYQALRAGYTIFITNLLQLIKDPIHRKMIATKARLQDEDDMSSSEAWMAAMQRRKHLLQSQVLSGIVGNNDEDDDKSTYVLNQNQDVPME